MKRIIIDARTVTAKKSGIGNYAEALIRHLVPLATDLRFTLIRQPGDTVPVVDDPRVTQLYLPGETKSASTFWIGRVHPFEDADLYHSPADIVPWGVRCPWVSTIHDMMWLETPHLCAAHRPTRLVLGAWYRAEYTHAIEGAQRIITISHASADAIGRVYPAQAHKVRVVHHGLDHARYDLSHAGPRGSLNHLVPEGVRYALIVGQGSPYKNHPGMLRAFIEASKSDSQLKIVLVRRFSRTDREMNDLLAKPGVAERVITVPFVKDAELLALYRHAEALLMASHAEGFGMPALEAMSMEVPLLVSTHPALAEVTGGVAISARSDDQADLVRGMKEVLFDRDRREASVAAGKQRARDFSWQVCAEKTLAVYREALSGAGPTY
jgi:glycosyltransferase involved in cell wall biosynthesis